jgi:hypothetical protein
VTRHQCAKCPWKKSTNPRGIPNGYCEAKHCNLRSTIADGASQLAGLRMMACHETPVGKEQPCVGWLNHQLGVGNNIGLRLAVMRDRTLASFEVDGPQHQTFEATLPKKRRHS